MENCFICLHTDTERIYQLTTMEGVLHFHYWLVPRRKEIKDKGLKFLSRENTCSDEQAARLAKNLHKTMNQK